MQRKREREDVICDHKGRERGRRKVGVQEKEGKKVHVDTNDCELLGF